MHTPSLLGWSLTIRVSPGDAQDPDGPEQRMCVSGRGTSCTFRVCPFLALLACRDKCLCPRGCLPVWASFVASHGPPWGWIVNSGHHIKHAICTPVGSGWNTKKIYSRNMNWCLQTCQGWLLKHSGKLSQKQFKCHVIEAWESTIGSWRKPLHRERCTKPGCPHQSLLPRNVRYREVLSGVPREAGPEGRGCL